MELDVTMKVSVKLEGSIDASTEHCIYVEHLKKKFSVNIPNGVTEGDKLRLKGLGMQLPDGRSGDLFLEFDDINNMGVYGYKHLFCIKCGQKLPEGSKFCLNCGWQIENIFNGVQFGHNNMQQETRKSESVGSVRKCSGCGETISSFVAICPSCGLEINSNKISLIISEFSEKIDVYDKQIANDTTLIKRGWAKWGTGRRVGWVILNIIFICIPLVIYLTIPLLGINNKSSLTKLEKEKIALIENFQIPNDREAILEMLLFINSKMIFLESEKYSKKKSCWGNVWKDKAKQIYKKVQILFSNDPIATDTYISIMERCKRIEKVTNIRRYIGISIIVVCILVFCLQRDWINLPLINEKYSIPTISDVTATDEEEGIYVYSIKDYVGKNVAMIGIVFPNEVRDIYGEGQLKISLFSDDGRLISADDIELKKGYIVVDQNIEAGTDLIIVHERNSRGRVSEYSVSYQNYDEIILYIEPIDRNSFEPEFVEIKPTVDRHIYHIRDYVGRNAASFGYYKGNGARADTYGEATVDITFSLEDGTYIEYSDIDELKKYIVIDQSVKANHEMEISYEKDNKGRDNQSWVEYQSIEEIHLTLRRLNDSVIFKMPQINKE